MSASLDQSMYQVRFAWSASGGALLAPAHVVVLVDGLHAGLDQSRALEPDGQADGARVVSASLRNRSAVADFVVRLQEERGERTTVNIVTVGGRESAGLDVADVLAAGAVLDALLERGIDHISPEAAVISAAYAGLRRARTHLINASSAGRELKERGEEHALAAALQLDVSDAVPEHASA